MSEERKSGASERPREETQSSMSILDRAASGQAPQIARMPAPDIRTLLPMRDGVRLDTFVWLPADRPAPTILLRTPYQEHVMGWRRLGILRYVEAGYAVVCQMIRGVGTSEGVYSFNNHFDRHDGFDTIGWIADQPWSDGNVGMDGSSYVGMTQLTAGAMRPPALKCLACHVPSADFFREIPYHGGGFSRQHTLNWTNLISIESLTELTGGFMGPMPVLAQPDWFRRITLRPAMDAADDLLKGDKLQHYRDVLSHPTYDDWWRERTIQAEDYRNIDIPVLVVTGNFDMSIGALTVWRGLEANAANPENRRLLIGPWDHGQAYAGGGAQFGPYALPEHSRPDLPALRLAFFDQHLRGRGQGPMPEARVRVYILGADVWRSFDSFPPREGFDVILHLSSGGRAQTARGDGRLTDEPPVQAEPADEMFSDPQRPFVPGVTSANLAQPLDVTELSRHGETLVYLTDPLSEPLTILGEPLAELTVSADAPDADVALWLAEINPEGEATRLATGFLRLRYREGWDKEVLLEPGRPVQARIPLTYVGRQVPAGWRIALMVGPHAFPLVETNTHTGEPVAEATGIRTARQWVHHGETTPSKLVLPCVA